jgi:hypothetical protein
MKCINCKNSNLVKIVKIGHQPISSLFYQRKKTKLKKYPLDLFQCSKCKLVQLSKLAPLKDMYGESYGYHTSLSPLMVNHMREKFSYLKKKFKIKKSHNILDIGFNDGTFLNFFGNQSFKNLFGIDPSSRKFSKFHHKNISAISDFFSKEKIFSIYPNKKFNLITSFAMFYDIQNPNKFCKDIENLLTKEGIWTLELSYFPLLIKNLTYDQICHEHIAYYDLNTINDIFRKNKLKILDLRFNDINGGSIEISCSKIKSKHKANLKLIKNILKDEISFYNENTYKNLNLRIDNTEKNLKHFLELIAKSKKKIYGYGASTKGNVTLNRIKANNKLISAIVDANPEKYNRYTPGTNIKIISKKYINKNKPDYLLVLIWSFRDEVIKQEKQYLLNGGKLIFHLPVLHIVDKNNYRNFIGKKMNCLN